MYNTDLSVGNGRMSTPTEQAYSELQHAYDVFNTRLFAGQLPPCLITMQRKNRTYGYCSGERWNDQAGAPGGTRTGQHMSHDVVAGGPFAQACTDLLTEGLVISWQDRVRAQVPGKGKPEGTAGGDSRRGQPVCAPNTPVQTAGATPG